MNSTKPPQSRSKNRKSTSNPPVVRGLAIDMIAEHHVRKFIKITAELDELIREIAESIPEAELYCPPDSICLMAGPSHTGNGQNHRENIAVCVSVARLSGGDW